MSIEFQIEHVTTSFGTLIFYKLLQFDKCTYTTINSCSITKNITKDYISIQNFLCKTKYETAGDNPIFTMC